MVGWVGSYQLSCQAPTQVEVELGCENLHNCPTILPYKFEKCSEAIYCSQWIIKDQTLFINCIAPLTNVH